MHMNGLSLEALDKKHLPELSHWVNIQVMWVCILSVV